MLSSDIVDCQSFDSYSTNYYFLYLSFGSELLPILHQFNFVSFHFADKKWACFTFADYSLKDFHFIDFYSVDFHSIRATSILKRQPSSSGKPEAKIWRQLLFHLMGTFQV